MGVVPATWGPSSVLARHRPPGPSGPAPLSTATRPVADRTARQLEGDDGGVDVGELPDRGGDAIGAAVVQQTPPTGGEAPSGQEHGELGVPVARDLGGELEGGSGPGAGRDTR